MELIIAKHCNSKTLHFKEYRYPVHYQKNGKNFYTDGNHLAKISMKEIPSMQYNTLNIGKALMEILNFLEYGSDSSASFNYVNDGKDDD